MRFWSSLILMLLISLGASFAQASPDSFVYQGRIVRSNGSALEYNSVSFAFTITNAVGNCILYREQKDGVDMQGSGGVFDVPIGSGTKLFPTTPGADIRKAFTNSVPLDCEGGGTYSPSETETRLLKVQFHDGVGWNAITPFSVIRSVPFSTFSYSAGRLGTNLPTDFVLKSSLATCAVGQYLTFDGTNFACQNDSGGSGTVSDVNVSSPLTKGGTAAIPTIGISVGTTAGTVAAGNDTRFGNATKIQGTTVDATAPTLGQVLRYDGTSSWIPATLAISDVSGLSTQLANKINATMFPTSCTAGQSLVFVTPANKFDCYDISITASQISGTIPFTKLASLPTTLSGYGITDAVQNLGGTPSFTSGLNSAKGAAGTSGRIYISTDTKEIYRSNGTTWDLISSASGSGGTLTGITASTGLTGGGTSGNVSVAVDVGTGANQIVQLDASSKLPAVDGSALTNLDPTKLSVVVPISKGGTGQSNATAGFNALSPATTKGDLITRDGTNNIRLPAGTNGQVLAADSTVTAGLKWVTANAGTVTGVTTTAPLSVSNGTTTPAISISSGTGDSQVLRWNTTNWAASYFNFSDLKSSSGSQQIPNSCTASQTLVWQSLSDTFACTSISVSGSNFATQAANLIFAGPTTGTAAPTFRALALSDLPSSMLSGSGTSGYVPYYNAASTLTNSPVYTSSTNVGINTTNPLTKLHVVGKALIGDTTSTTNGASVLMLYGGNTANGNTGLDVVAAATATPQTPAHQFSFRMRSDAGGIYRGAIGMTNSSTPNETMTFLNNGNIGIGTSTPTATLHVVKGASGYVMNMDGPSNGWIATGYNIGGVNKAQIGIAGGPNTFLSSSGEASGDFVVRGAANNLLLAAGSGETMRLTQTGNVGIGTTNPTAMLSVKGGALFGDKSTFPTDFNTIETNTYTNSLYNNTATSGTFGSLGSWMRVSPTADSTLSSQAVSAGLSFNVPSGVTVTSNSDAIWVNAARNRYAGNADNGTVTSIRAISVGYGHENYVAGVTPQTTAAYGLAVSPSVASGTITNMYDLYLGTKSGAGTVTNRFGLYQSDSSATNTFMGQLGVGTATPVGKFDTVTSGSDTIAAYVASRYDNDGTTIANAIVGRRARGTVAAPTAVQSGDRIFSILGTAYNGSTWQNIGGIQMWASENQTATANGSFITFETNPASAAGARVERMRISDSGNVGIGTSSPSGQLHVAVNAPTNYGIIKNENTATGGQPWRWLSSATGAPLGADAMCFGIGTCLFTLRTTGNATLTGTLTQNSDVRLKKDIKTIPSSLAKIDQIRGVSYNWIDFSRDPKTQLGVIAQEVEPIFPELVRTDNEGIKSVNYLGFIAPLINAVKELHHKWSDDSAAIHAQLDKQSREIASLKEENFRLKNEERASEARLRKLEQRLEALEKSNGK
ncbi:tail fiber domain-containing protein [Bdellovibrio sp. HCB209]|uniref:tail fiber domain-containing protein n=1 Tax=Bdellovibrio sp. HCB209 TaxID=3394354 RepID=UPI0039B66EDF